MSMHDEQHARNVLVHIWNQATTGADCGISNAQNIVSMQLRADVTCPRCLELNPAEPSNEQLGIPAELTDFAAALDAFDRPSYVEGASYLFFIDNDPRFVLDDHSAADRTIDALKQDGVTVRAIAVMNNPTEDQLVAAGIGRAQ